MSLKGNFYPRLKPIFSMDVPSDEVIPFRYKECGFADQGSCFDQRGRDQPGPYADIPRVTRRAPSFAREEGLLVIRG